MKAEAEGTAESRPLSVELAVGGSSTAEEAEAKIEFASDAVRAPPAMEETAVGDNSPAMDPSLDVDVGAEGAVDSAPSKRAEEISPLADERAERAGWTGKVFSEDVAAAAAVVSRGAEVDSEAVAAGTGITSKADELEKMIADGTMPAGTLTLELSTADAGLLTDSTVTTGEEAAAAATVVEEKVASCTVLPVARALAMRASDELKTAGAAEDSTTIAPADEEGSARLSV